MVKNIHNIIKAEYDKKQRNAYESFMAKKEELYQRLPELLEIDSQIQLMGVKYNKAILLGNSPVESAISGLLEKLRALKSEKKRLLEESGLPSDYLVMEYQCPSCQDTGYVHSPDGAEKCFCYTQQFLNLLYQQSNLKLTETENFDTFNENFYPDIVNKSIYGLDVSPRENILFIKDSCLRFVNNFASPEEKNLFFCGRTGVGKTFMTNCIASELIKKEIPVLYQTAGMLFNIINEYKMKAFKNEEYEDSGYRDIFEVPLLIIDDLGTESPSAARYAELLNIINTRQINNLTKPCKTIISSNIGIKKLHEYYDERIVSRIVGSFDIFMFIGEDIRKMKS